VEQNLFPLLTAVSGEIDSTDSVAWQVGI